MNTLLNEHNGELSDDYVNAFLQIDSLSQLAKFINVKTSQLEYFLFYAHEDQKYYSFTIKKRNGNERQISAPKLRLKKIQTQFQAIFQHLYNIKPCVHGFVAKRDIVSNAKLHINKRILVNIDLKDFFHTIHFGRVRGVFLSHPFKFNETVALALAKLCCFNGVLPQGSPTSPILSNFVCRGLDNDFMKLSKSSKMTYSRYADDITISTNLMKLSPEIGLIENLKISLSHQVEEIMTKNGFKINYDKVRFSFKNNRQEVTGLTVNKFLNVRRSYVKHVRSMLHAWDEYGLELASNEHFYKFNPKTKLPKNFEASFVKELTGKINYIGQIKGRDNPVYEKLYRKIKKLAPTVSLSIMKKEANVSIDPILFTEGKTDSRHLAAAFKHFNSQGIYNDLTLNIHHFRDEDRMSNSELLKFCHMYPKIKHTHSVVICLFDRDDVNFLTNVTSIDNPFKSWGNRVYSMVLPIPSHRNFYDITIEHYYSDKELTKKDINGRRIFLSNEFHPKTGKHFKENLYFSNLNKLKNKKVQIIDSGVFDNNKISMALSKNKLAENILNADKGFENMNFDEFRLVFDAVAKIINLSNKEVDILPKIENALA